MSKISTDFLKKSIKQIVTPPPAPKGKFNFQESIELQIGLRDYDPEKDKRFSGQIKLPNVPHPRIKVAVIGTVQHCDQAKAAGVPFIDVEGLRKFNKDKTLIKKWAKHYDVLISSESLMKQIPKLLGNVLNKIGMFPIVMQENEQVSEKVKEVKSTVKFQLKKVLCMGTAIGTIELTEDQIRANLITSINFLVSLLKKGWQNIKSLTIKTTQGKPIRIYG